MNKKKLMISSVPVLALAIALPSAGLTENEDLFQNVAYAAPEASAPANKADKGAETNKATEGKDEKKNDESEQDLNIKRNNDGKFVLFGKATKPEYTFVRQIKLKTPLIKDEVKIVDLEKDTIDTIMKKMEDELKKEGSTEASAIEALKDPEAGKIPTNVVREILKVALNDVDGILKDILEQEKPGHNLDYTLYHKDGKTPLTIGDLLESDSEKGIPATVKVYNTTNKDISDASTEFNIRFDDEFYNNIPKKEDKTNKKDLEKIIDEAEKDHPENNDKDDKEWLDRLWVDIKKGKDILAKEKPTQKEVDKAHDDIKDILDENKKSKVDFSKLIEARDKADALTKNPGVKDKKDAVKVLGEAIKEANDLINNKGATQEEVDRKTHCINRLIDGILGAIKGNLTLDEARSQLAAEIEKAKGLSTEGKTPESIKALEDAIKSAEAELNNPEATVPSLVSERVKLIEAEALKDLAKKENPLEDAKKAAKDEIDKLPNLTDKEKEAFKKKIDEAIEVDQIKPIVDEAKKLNDSRIVDSKALEKAKRDAKRVIEALPHLTRDEKYGHQDRIDDVEKIEDIKPIVDEAIKLNEERAKADELQKYKEAAIAKVNESTLPDDVKKGFVDRINAAESKEAVDKIMAEFDALNAEHKALLEAKRAAKEAIENLANLPDNVKAELKAKIDAAKTIPEVEAVLNEARELDNKYANEAEFNKFKENAKAAIDKLANLTDEEKAGFKGRIDEAKDKQEVQNILDEARDLNNLRQQDINQNKANEALVNAITDAINKLQGQNKEENDKTIAILQQLLEKANGQKGITAEDLDSFKAELLKGLKSIDFSGGITEDDINKIVLAIKANKVDIDLSNLATHDDISNQTEQLVIALDRLTRMIQQSNESYEKHYKELISTIENSKKNTTHTEEINREKSTQTIDKSLLNKLRDAYFNNRVEARALEELLSKTPKTVKPFKTKLESQLSRSKSLTDRAKTQLDKYDTKDKSAAEKALEDAIFENRVQARAVEILLEENPKIIKGYESRFKKVLQESYKLTDKGNRKLRELRNKREGSKTASLSSLFFTTAYASSDFDSSAAEDLINELDSSTDDMKNLRNEVENSGEEKSSTKEKENKEEKASKDNAETKDTNDVITSDSDKKATEEVKYTSGLSSENASTNASNGQANHNSKTGVGSVLGALGVLGGSSALLYGLSDKKKKNRD